MKKERGLGQTKPKKIEEILPLYRENRTWKILDWRTTRTGIEPGVEEKEVEKNLAEFLSLYY
jgi:hypothetical protein